MNETKPQTIRAVVGSQLSRDEEIFGSLYDRKVIRRFASYVRPYRRSVIIAIGSVLIYTTAQMLIPLIIQSVIDHAIIEKNTLHLVIGIVIFFAAITTSYGANYLQDRIVGLIGEKVIFLLHFS